MKLPLTALCLSLLPFQLVAGALDGISGFDAGTAQIVLLGEVHDNPAHHRNQAVVVESLAPAAIVFEMLNPDQAETVSAMAGEEASAIAEALDWKHSGWPEFAMYHQILTAAPGARIYGAAIPRSSLSEAVASDAATVFGPDAERFGLGPLPGDQQVAREAMQMEAHCNALPEHMLSGMVEAQRLRDARFSETALTALSDTAGPVVVITGNGHARRDWGMPVYLTAAAPEVEVVTLGQFEAPFDGAPSDVPHDAWLVTERAEREDPCAVFRKP